MSGADLTDLLQRASDGGDDSRKALLAAVYQQLRRISMGLVRNEAPEFTLSATDVVHEAYFKLFGSDASWENRRHFFASAASAMRRILVDHARRKNTIRRTASAETLVQASDSESPQSDNGVELLALDQAIEALAVINPRQAKVVELRDFVGLADTEIAEVLGISRMTVNRDWRVAQMRLRQALSG